MIAARYALLPLKLQDEFADSQSSWSHYRRLCDEREPYFRRIRSITLGHRLSQDGLGCLA